MDTLTRTHFLTEAVNQEDLHKLQPGTFNVIAAPRGAGKTTFMFDPRILELARAKEHIIYLIHNNASKSAIVANHPQEAAFLDLAWVSRHTGVPLWGDENDDRIVVMCYQTLAALLRHNGPHILDQVDLVVWDEFDDVGGFYKQELGRIRKLLPNFTPERLAAILEEGNDKSIIAFIYQMKKLVLDPARIVLLAISATPELAANLFKDYINYIIHGKIEEVYAAQETVVIESVRTALLRGDIRPGDGRKFWCYTQRVADELEIEKLAQDAGFRTVTLWSPSNTYWAEQYTPEKARIADHITQHHKLPDDCDCDFLIVNGVMGRSVDWYDTSFQDWICNSTEYEELGQFIRARFQPKRQYLLKEAAGLVEYVRKGPSPFFYEWHTPSEMKVEFAKMTMFDDKQQRLANWNQARKYFMNKGMFETKFTRGVELVRLKKRTDKADIYPWETAL